MWRLSLTISKSLVYPNLLYVVMSGYILLDSLLFKLVTTPEKETALLAIPDICTDNIIMLYHSSLFAGHQGVIKTYLTIEDKSFIPGYIHILRDIFVNYQEMTNLL